MLFSDVRDCRCACDDGYAPWGRKCMGKLQFELYSECDRTSIPPSLDMNECISGVANCDPNADCFNTPGSFVCVCRAGFIGDGFTCSPIATNPCGSGFVLSGNMCIGERS